MKTNLENLTSRIKDAVNEKSKETKNLASRISGSLNEKSHEIGATGYELLKSLSPSMATSKDLRPWLIGGGVTTAAIAAIGYITMVVPSVDDGAAGNRSYTCVSGAARQARVDDPVDFYKGIMDCAGLWDDYGGFYLTDWVPLDRGLYKTFVTPKLAEDVVDGVPGSGLNSCASGVFIDLPDSATAYSWHCMGYEGGRDVTIYMPRYGPSSGLNSCASGTLTAYENLDLMTGYVWRCEGQNGE